MTQDLHWQKSTFSEAGDGNTCVEVASTHDSVHLRESDAPGAVLTTTPAALARLLGRLREAPTTPSR
ncbi:hypothetical protein C9F11_14860 [Streptomyces sp. YIM 121038]|uniref:DUF397 domain-containing protein n=1 Tax=Streptomyces sp. YIM 121038 TaxID=2136401 RepID=UPI001110CF19|nr:DUF397 domain-containing protein [Streptomyces sp. YIM 121038]QCX76641.1 hypothetical protein C9F11_14860 [Streptomyces sp. YIM 121038]